MEEHIRRIGAVREIPHFVDQEYGRVNVPREHVGELSISTRGGEFVDELGRGDTERIEAVLNGAISNRDGQMRLPASGLTAKKSHSGLP